MFSEYNRQLEQFFDSDRLFWCLRILAQGDHPQKVWSQSVFGVLEELIRKEEEQSSRKDFEQRILQQLLDELSDLAAVSELLEVTLS